MTTYKVGLVGLGKIAEDQHIPVIAENPAFELAAIATRSGKTAGGVPTYPSPGEMLAAVPEIDCVALCTPPSVRTAMGLEALAAGKHVLLEKPPAATVSEITYLKTVAADQDRVLFATWHSRYNAAVIHARELLAGKTIRRLMVTWKEDVRYWHPGQKWIWEAGGFGVFDPGINALSIVTAIMPTPLFIQAAELTVPSNCQTPIAATLEFATTVPSGSLRSEFDWRQTGEQTWDIEIETDEGNTLKLSKGGAILRVNGAVVIERSEREYEDIYIHFAELLGDNRSDVDDSPLRLVADAYLAGQRVETEAFYD